MSMIYQKYYEDQLPKRKPTTQEKILEASGKLKDGIAALGAAIYKEYEKFSSRETKNTLSHHNETLNNHLINLPYKINM